MPDFVRATPRLRAHAPGSRVGVADPVFREQVRMLYATLPVSQGAAVSIGIVLAAVQAVVIEPARVIGWLACLLIVSVARVRMRVLFRRSSHSEDIIQWRMYSLAGTVSSGLVWGSTALVLYPPDSVIHQIFIAFTLGGMVLGGAALLAPVFPVFVLFAICTLLPTIVRYALVGDYIHYAMSGMGAVFLLAMLAIGRFMHSTVMQSLKLRFENHELIAYLRNARQQAESVNASLLATQEALRKSNEALETRVAQRTAELQAADARKDEFLAMLSHELRNPLAPIRNSVYILRRVDATSEQARRAGEVIERQTQYVTRLVDDLLDVTRIARGKIELRRERVNLADLVKRTVEDHSSVFKQSGVLVRVDVPSAPVWTIADPTRIAQMLGNLLQNAAKFTPAGGETSVSLHVADQCAEVRVSDTGAGIDPALLPVLFEPFTQGRRSPARTEGGLGLGLALVKGLIELHKATVRVESSGPGKGSTFIVRLPLTVAGAASDTLRPPVHRITPARCVLVVDDNRDAADSLAQIVEMFGHSVEVAYDGNSAVEKARAKSPDVVLCDLGLPGMTGYEVARQLRSKCGAIRLIAVSGYAQPEDIVDATAAGFDGHVAKPPDPETVRRLLS